MVSAAISAMKTDDFDFDLPRERIAQAPANPRDSARLLHIGAKLADHTIRDLPGLLRQGDVLVVNDTRVIPARLRGKRGEASIEVTLHLRTGPVEWRAFARPQKRLKLGDVIHFSDDFRAEVTDKVEGGEIGLLFSGMAVLDGLNAHGIMPLPPYIARPKEGEASDLENYQTYYAARPGAVAAPTAGLHFTESLVTAIEKAGVKIVQLTLHVGAGTFLPVKVDRIADHKMHSEWGKIGEEAAQQINQARASGGRIVACGTTSLRLLESAATPDGIVEPFEAETDIFITPGYRFRATDALLTNFHLPRSTLFMLVSAFAGQVRMKQAYTHAIAAKYRFYSYGDACLLERENTL
jgi:S-adenosylmethionine:tRNA ribosyltransferase-isomerase